MQDVRRKQKFQLTYYRQLKTNHHLRYVPCIWLTCLYSRFQAQLAILPGMCVSSVQTDEVAGAMALLQRCSQLMVQLANLGEYKSCLTYLYLFPKRKWILNLVISQQIMETQIITYFLFQIMTNEKTSKSYSASED